MKTSILHFDYHVDQGDYTRAGKVSSKIKQALSSIGINRKILRNIAVASYEAEINMIIHAYGGSIHVDVYDDGTLVIQFNDLGPGIENVEQAMVPGYSTASDQAREMGFGAGMGLPNMKRVCDEFTIETSPEGTHLTMLFKIA